MREQGKSLDEKWQYLFPLAFFPQDIERVTPVIAEIRTLIDRGEVIEQARPSACLTRALNIAAAARQQMQDVIGSEEDNPLEESTSSLRQQILNNLQRLEAGDLGDDDDLLAIIEDRHARLVDLVGTLTGYIEAWRMSALYVENIILKAESEEPEDCAEEDVEDTEVINDEPLYVPKW